MEADSLDLPITQQDLNNNTKKVVKTDRLPTFTLNYLELMDECMQNLSYKSSLAGSGNPIALAATQVTLPQATRGVFKEARAPQPSYMARRQLNQQYRPHQTGNFSEGRAVSQIATSMGLPNNQVQAGHNNEASTGVGSNEEGNITAAIMREMLQTNHTAFGKNHIKHFMKTVNAGFGPSAKPRANTSHTTPTAATPVGFYFHNQQFKSMFQGRQLMMKTTKNGGLKEKREKT